MTATIIDKHKLMHVYDIKLSWKWISPRQQNYRWLFISTKTKWTLILSLNIAMKQVRTRIFDKVTFWNKSI